MPEDHEGREIYGLRLDPTPEKGRALGRVAERQGREINKGGPAEDTTSVDEIPPADDMPPS